MSFKCRVLATPDAIGVEQFMRMEIDFVLHRRAAVDPESQIIKWNRRAARQFQFVQNRISPQRAFGFGGVEIEINAAKRLRADIADANADQLSAGIAIADLDGFHRRLIKKRGEIFEGM